MVRLISFRWTGLGRVLAVALLIAVAVSAAACEEVSTLLAEPTKPALKTSGELSVDLRIVEGGSGSVLALVPVWIGEDGPYLFALDTGASQTVIDRQLVDDLGLEVGDLTGPLIGVTGATQARTVKVDDWQLGEVGMPPIEALTMDLPQFYVPQRLNRPQSFRGLLGSDILSRFGVVTIDYDQARLVLQSRL